jgi:hypothetical protein
MMKGRGGVLLFLVIIALVVAAFFYLRGGGAVGSLFAPRQEEPLVPLDLQLLIPAGWSVQPALQQACNFDDDGDQERLIIYRYDATLLPLPLAEEPATVDFAPFGGVIYDTQAGTLQPQPDSPGPYRASNLVPYKLLPDYYPRKGQGYLGETRVEVRYAPPLVAGDGCTTTEIVIYGFSHAPLPTRLSVFRWAGVESGYEAAHFAGDARVDAHTTDTGFVDGATTYNRLLNHRSVLCEVAGHARDTLDELAFRNNPDLQTIDFCFGAPPEPFYPEGVVVALLRGKSPLNAQAPSFLLDNAIVPPELAALKTSPRDPINIISVGNPSFVEAEPQSGRECLLVELAAASNVSLWCSRERVRVETRILLGQTIRDVVWILISVAPDQPNGNLFWRVAEIELQ